MCTRLHPTCARKFTPHNTVDNGPPVLFSVPMGEFVTHVDVLLATVEVRNIELYGGIIGMLIDQAQSAFVDSFVGSLAGTAIQVSLGSATIQRSSFLYGGPGSIGVYLSSGGPFTVQDIVSEGEAVYSSNAGIDTVITGLNATRNPAAASDLFAVDFAGASLALTDSNIVGYGTGVRISGSGTFTIGSTTIADCSTIGNGGGLRVVSGAGGVIGNGTVIANNAATLSGGGLYSSSSGVITFAEGVMVTGNSAGQQVSVCACGWSSRA